MLVPFDQLDKWGIVKDVRPKLLAPEAWSDGLNIRFRNGSIEKVQGSVPIFGTPGTKPHWLMQVFAADEQPIWIYASLAKVYMYDGTTHSNITRQTAAVDVDYAATENRLWNGGILGGIPVLNNGVDVPQQWGPISSAQKLVALSNWPSTWQCHAIRPFKAFLVAMNLTEAGTRFIHRIRVSHPAVPGAVPLTWDETDPTKDAVLVELSDTENGALLDGAVMGDLFLLYKERSTHAMQFTGGTQRFRFFSVFRESGLLATDCVTAFDEGRMHFVATGDDIIVHNMQQRQSLLDRRLKKWLAANMSADTYMRSYCVPNVQDSEVWFCFPLEGAAWPNMALIWDRVSNAISFKELDQASRIAPGQVVASSGAWDSDSEAWDDDTRPWQELAHRAYLQQLVQARPDGSVGSFLHLEQGYQYDGEAIVAYVERTGNAAIGVNGSGGMVQEFEHRKLLTSVFIQSSGGPLTVQIATQQKADGPISWSEKKVFNPSVDRKIDFVMAGLLWGIRFEQTGAEPFSLQSYKVDIEPLGRF